MILWIHLMHDHLLDQLIQESYERPILVFVHNRYEEISNMRMAQIEVNSKSLPRHLKTYYLDGVKYPHLVSQLSHRLNFQNSVPPTLVISLGKFKSEFYAPIAADQLALAPAAA